MADPKLSRGYRNKNPGNLDYVASNKWQGQTGIEKTGNPPRFAVFSRHEYGIRALAALLTTYFDRHNLKTVRGIINRWAPSSENNTSAYVMAVAKGMGVGPDTPLNLHTYAHLYGVVTGIIRHEIAGMPYTEAQLNEGLTMAGVPKPIDTVAKAAVTKTGTAALTVGSVTSAVAVMQPMVSSLAGLPQWVGVALVVAAALLVAGYFVLQRMETR